MSYLIRLIFVGCICWFTHVYSNDVLFEDQRVALSIPSCPLGDQALQIETEHSFFTEWTESQHRAAYRMQRAIALIWKKAGITHYLSLGKNDFQNTSRHFYWQVIPFPDQTIAIIKQVNIVKNILFEKNCPSSQQLNEEKTEPEGFIQDFTKEISDLPTADNYASKGTDPFCQANIIESQLILDGRHVMILYNYAPLVDLSFLVITKAHRPTFLEMTEEEYIEAQWFTTHILNHFEEQGYSTAYIYHKSGSRAGQSVPHWHQHVTLPDPKQSNVKAFIKILQNTFFGSSPLNSSELNRRVNLYKSELNDSLKK